MNEVNQKTISHLLAWNEATQKWIRLRTDSSGRLIISAPGLSTQHVISKINATDTESNTTLSEPYTSHIIYNEGPNDVYVEFDQTASTDSWKIPAGSTLSIDIEFKSLHYICDSGNTATIRWLALR